MTFSDFTVPVSGAAELNEILRALYGEDADTISEASYPDRLINQHGETVAVRA